MGKIGTNENIKDFAKQIVQYETQDKGFFGKLFAFEARDGFISKAMKVIGVINGVQAAALTFVSLTNPIVGIGGLAAAGAAVAAGLTSSTINRTVMKSVLSDVHDTKTSFLGKAAHYFGSGITSYIPSAIMAVAAGSVALAVGGPITAQLTANLTFLLAGPIVFLGINKVVNNITGDQEQRKDWQQARELAQQAIQTGQSVEQLLGHEQSAQTGYTNTVTQQEHSQERGDKFTKMIDAERNREYTLEIG